MSQLDFFVEAANNGFTSNIQITKSPEKIEYGITLVLAQGTLSKVLPTVEEGAKWLEDAIIDWFPESDFAQRLLRARAEQERAEKEKQAGVH